MQEEEKCVLSESNTKAFLLGIALGHTSNYDHIANACNLVDVMAWDVNY